MSTSPFTSAHRLYVKSLYKRMLKLEQDWAIQYTLFRPRALAVRAQFEANRSVELIFAVCCGLFARRRRARRSNKGLEFMGMGWTDTDTTPSRLLYAL